MCDTCNIAEKEDKWNVPAAEINAAGRASESTVVLDTAASEMKV